MILEGIVTTCDETGRPHLAPMGPIVDAEMQQLVLRPFQTSQTFANLKRSREGVFHVTDDVELLAAAAVGQLKSLPRLERATAVDSWIIVDTCRWHAFRITQCDDRSQRAEMTADVVERGTIRDFVGFNRAKHAIVELAIVSTRVGILPDDEILAEFCRLEPLIGKTGGQAEARAFELLRNYVEQAIQNALRELARERR